MAVWFSGQFGTKHKFKILKYGDRAVYSAELDGHLYTVREDPERELLEPSRSIQCYRIDTGLFIFPWRWGHAGTDWPRFEPKVGDTQLISLAIERGAMVEVYPGQRQMMVEIKKLLIKDSKRFERLRRRASQ